METTMICATGFARAASKSAPRAVTAATNSDSEGHSAGASYVSLTAGVARVGGETASKATDTRRCAPLMKGVMVPRHPHDHEIGRGSGQRGQSAESAAYSGALTSKPSCASHLPGPYRKTGAKRSLFRRRSAASGTHVVNPPGLYIAESCKRRQPTKFFAGGFGLAWQCAVKETSAPTPVRLLGSVTLTSPLWAAVPTPAEPPMPVVPPAPSVPVVLSTQAPFEQV
jgi:hypothetical protein